MSAPASPTRTIGSARLVAKYRGAQIYDARESILIKFDATPKRGIAGQLHNSNWHRDRDTGVWSKKATPQSIFAAQMILNDAYGSAE